MTESQSLLSSPEFLSAKKALLDAVARSSARVGRLRPPSGNANHEDREAYLKLIEEFQRDRGRELYFPFLSSGIGHGPWIELMDGSVRYDMISAIGVNFFGHTHPAVMSELIDGLSSDVYQGNLMPGIEAKRLVRALLERVGSNSRLRHAWLTTCGTMANENALKIIRQKRAPATKILAFRDCFAGRSTAMAEITDNPGYRQGLPVYGEVYYLPFYDPSIGLEASVRATLGAMRDHLTRYPDKFAALMMELVQGEGGFNYGPREYYVRVFEEAKKANLAIWIDEIQTFGRTGEYFAYQTFDLSEYVDVVTVAKMLQSSVVLFTEEYNPRPGLVAGTFSGASGALRAARRVLELLEEGKFLGKEGRIARLSGRFADNLSRIAKNTCNGLMGEIRVLGGMIAFVPLGGTMDEAKSVLMRLFDLGVIAFYCGHGPYLIRLLPPLGAMEEKHVDEVCRLIETALLEAAADRGTAKKESELK